MGSRNSTFLSLFLPREGEFVIWQFQECELPEDCDDVVSHRDGIIHLKVSHCPTKPVQTPLASVGIRLPINDIECSKTPAKLQRAFLKRSAEAEERLRCGTLES